MQLTPLLNIKKLGKLQSSLSGDALEKALTHFCRELERRHEKIQSSVKKENHVALMDEIHFLKGAAGTFGADSLMETIRQAEDAVVKRDFAALRQIGVELCAHIVNTIEELKKLDLRSDLSGPSPD